MRYCGCMKHWLMSWQNQYRKQAAPVKLLTVLFALAVLLGIWARLYKLGSPDKIIFDEVYFPVFAWNYLHHIQSFDAHPPLGKFIIALPLWLFGNTSFAWRLMPALFGITFIPLAGYTWWRYQKDRVGALIFMIIVALEGLLITYSRTGLMDGVLLFFVLLTFLLSLSATTTKRLFFLATCLGLAIAIKWVALGVIIPVAYIMIRNQVRNRAFLAVILWAGFVYLFIIYLGNLIGRVEHPFNYIWQWQYEAFNYHWDLKATHPWGSKWWSWPFMLRPVLFSYDTNSRGEALVISAIGNPIIWWSSTVAVLFGLRELILERFLFKKSIIDHPLAPLLLGYASFLLPWIGIARVQFIYHYLSAYGFALLTLTYFLSRIWKKYPWLVIGYLVIVLAITIFYLPMQINWPMTQQWLHYRLWLKSWL